MARRVLYREAADHSHHTLGPARRDQGDISRLAGVWLAGGQGGCSPARIIGYASNADFNISKDRPLFHCDARSYAAASSDRGDF